MVVVRGQEEMSFSVSSLPTVCECFLLACFIRKNQLFYILLHLITSYSSYFRGKKGISENKTSFFLLMLCAPCPDSPTHLCLPVCESPLLAPRPDLPTHLCYPVCESPWLTRLLPVLTCPPICAFQFMSPPCLLCILTYPPICAIQFVSPPHSLTRSTPCLDLPTHLCFLVCESPLLACCMS